MNKHSWITLIAIIIIVISMTYSGLNIAGTYQLEYRWGDIGRFNYFNMSNDGKMEFCNTMPFWMSFQNFEIETFYQSEYVGSYIVQPVNINPFSSIIEKGNFITEERTYAQYVFMTFDLIFDGGPMRLDPNHFTILVNINTPILGIIPHSTTTQISGFEFDQIMNSEDLSCN